MHKTICVITEGENWFIDDGMNEWIIEGCSYTARLYFTYLCILGTYVLRSFKNLIDLYCFYL